jgi:hypothetical protein
VAQQQDGKATDRPKKDYRNSLIVKRMMAFDKNKDGKLTKDEVTDVRLHRLFDQADTNKDGVVTKEELIALAAKLEAEYGPDGGRGFGRFGGPGGFGPGGFGLGGPPGGPPRPGQILPPFLQERLKLTDKQKKQLQELQKEVDAGLAKILTKDQMKQLREMRPRFGPGGPRGPGPGGPPRGAGRGRPDRPAGDRPPL